MSYLYVALGDSLSVGVGASIFSPGFVQRYQRLATTDLGEHVYVQTFAHPGFQSLDVLLELDNDFVKEQIKDADIITITAGGNDLIQAARKFQIDHNEQDFSLALNECMKNFGKIMNGITDLKHDCIRPYIIRLVNLYNPFPNDPLAVKWIRKFNLHIKSFLKNPVVSIAEVDKIFKDHEKEYIARDGIHPNDIGYERIAESLHQLGYGELALESEEE
ncbi:GDSL-type esterase/lipase family protein [Bacillus sp. EB600]|uniref:GDSL-type esterase/lipase family protein n=1 Tax=Bacillus sp. EB600 TaxID=2806345 RepID=UPI00210B78AE|nr:GDSL-type esterase/lipase family protein [Bacillus sp. EB600]MCQ6282724.1 spore gernimation protein [Bacillus sp. EB600]